MTLIELIVALAIAGIVMTAGYASLALLADRRVNQEATTDSTARAAAVRRTLREWLSGIVLDAADDTLAFRGFDGVFHDLPDDELTFRTTASTPVSPAGARVRLFVSRAESTSAQGLMAVVEDTDTGARQSIPLDPQVAGLDVTYLDGPNLASAWTWSWISSSVLPVAIRVSLRSRDGGSLPALLRVPITVPLGRRQ